MARSDQIKFQRALQAESGAGPSKQSKGNLYKLKICDRIHLHGDKNYIVREIHESATFNECQQILRDAVHAYEVSSGKSFPSGRGWSYWKLDSYGDKISDKLDLDQYMFPAMMQFFKHGGYMVLLDHDVMHEDMFARKDAWKVASEWVWAKYYFPILEWYRFDYAPTSQYAQEAVTYLERMGGGRPHTPELDNTNWP